MVVSSPSLPQAHPACDRPKSTKVSRDTVLRRETETLDAPATRCSSSYNKTNTEGVTDVPPPRESDAMAAGDGLCPSGLRAHFPRRWQRRRGAERLRPPRRGDARLEYFGQPHRRGFVHGRATQGGLTPSHDPVSTRRLRLEFGVPVEVVEPAFVQIIGREQAAVAVQLEHRWPIGQLPRLHARVVRQMPALTQIARSASRYHVVPARLAAARARDQVIEGKIILAAAVLAGEAIAQEHIEACKGRIERGLYIGLE